MNSDRVDRRQPRQLELNQRRHKPDFALLMLSLLLLVIGLVVIYAISPGLAVQKNVSANYFVSKQFIAILLGVFAFLFTANVSLKFWQNIQNQLIVLAGISVVAVRLLGDKTNGAYRWIQIGGFSFQAVELMKFALIIWLATFLCRRIVYNELGDYKKTFQPILAVLVIIGFTVAYLQSDLGSTVVLSAITISMSFVSGIPLKKIGMIGVLGAIGVLLLVSSTPYRRQRFTTFFNPQKDCLNEGYQACQALIAVGSGGLFGKGFAHDVQAYGYLPEAANDSIFAIMGEKFGFLGLIAVLSAFILFFSRLKNIMLRAPDNFTRLLVAGVLGWLSAQTMINIGAMIGLLPIKGITLPFLSYGGTSVVFVTAAVGLVFNISRYTLYDNGSATERGSHDNYSQRRGNGRTHHAYLSRRK